MELEIRAPMYERRNRPTRRNIGRFTDVDAVLIETETDRMISHDDEDDDDCCDTGTSMYTIQYVLYVHSSRVLWYGLIPLLYDDSSSSSSIFPSSYTIQYIMQHHIRILPNATTSSSSSRSSTTNIPSTGRDDNIGSAAATASTTTSTRWFLPKYCPNMTSSSSVRMDHKLMVRSFQWRKKRGKDRHQRIKIILWLVPPQTTTLEYTFMRYLLRYEHIHIRAQSISGYISTIGGGYFLCHHFHTAIVLAQYQQYLARLLNDDFLYYTCFVQMAYSYIYNGHFATAQSILHNVQRDIDIKMLQSSSSSTTHHKYEILQKMCHSAQLFGRRMRRYTKRLQSTMVTTKTTTVIPTNQLRIGPTTKEEDVHHHKHDIIKDTTQNDDQRPPTSTTVVTKTIDNYQRIRIVPDQSKPHDFVVPFSSTTTIC